MVGRRDAARPRSEPQAAGEAVVQAHDVDVDGATARRCSMASTSRSRGGEILGLAGVSGNGQSALADLSERLAAAERRHGASVRRSDPAVATARIVERGVGRIPEDRHAIGLHRRHVGDGECRHGDAIASRAFAARPVRLAGGDGASPKRSSPITTSNARRRQRRCGCCRAATCRSSSSAACCRQAPRFILANQPTRGLDVGAIAYVHAQLLAARQARAASILLISEDLDEILRFPIASP